MNRKKMLLVFNPKAGREEFRLNLYEVVEIFTRSGYEVTVYPTAGKGDGYQLIRERGTEYDYLVCSGGDGTVNESLEALMACEKKPVFGFIPAGTTNDYAATLGIPRDILQAADTVVNGRTVSIDVGRFDKGYFAYVAGFGLFTDVPYATSQDAKNVLGHAAYVWEGMKRLTSIKDYSCELVVDGEEIAGEFILGLVSNATSIGGFHLMGEREISLQDGLFEVVLVRSPKKLADLHEIARRLMDHSHDESDAIVTRKAARITVTSREEIPWTLDGEFGGATACADIENCYRALRIRVPVAPQ